MAALTAPLSPVQAAVPPALEVIDPAPFVRRDGKGGARLELAIKGARCANCIAKIEGGLKGLDGVTDARLNLSTGKLAVRWREASHPASAILGRVLDLGYEARPYDPEAQLRNEDEEGRALLKALAMAGFAAANVMLLSVSIWAGAGDMGDGTRTLFHWISGLIAIPAALYAGQTFFRSALKSLRAGHANMDVPISLAIILALALSIYQSAIHGENAYFDAAVTLPFLLLIGRYLDHMLRRRARSAARDLVAMQAVTATRLDAEGHAHRVMAREIAVGDRLLLATGERAPVDGVVEDFDTEADVSLVTGESAPVIVKCGALLRAGSIVTGRGIVLKAAARVEDSLVAELARLLEAGQQNRSRYVRLADRAASIYVPAVHGLALSVFLGWLLYRRFAVDGADQWHRASDHHLPLCARSGRAGGADRGHGAPVQARHSGEVRRRAGAARRNRHRRLRQDRHAHHRPAGSRQWRCDRGGHARIRRQAGARKPPSAGARTGGCRRHRRGRRWRA